MKPRLVILKCAGYILWRLLLRRLYSLQTSIGNSLQAFVDDNIKTDVEVSFSLSQFFSFYVSSLFLYVYSFSLSFSLFPYDVFSLFICLLFLSLPLSPSLDFHMTSSLFSIYMPSLYFYLPSLYFVLTLIKTLTNLLRHMSINWSMI